MRKTSLLFGALSAAAITPLAVSAQQEPASGNQRPDVEPQLQSVVVQRPNVVFIYADDLGYGDLECYGAHNVETPNVNRLAREGCRFTNAFAVAATSTPSRYSLLTGEYSWRRKGTDIARGDAGMIIRPEQYTVADLFKNEGYATGAFGKWHLGLGDKTGEQDWNAPLPCGLGDLGFDYSYIMAATGDRVPCVFIENGRVANWDAANPIYVSYDKPFPGVPTGKDHPELCYNQMWDYGHNQAIVNGIGRIGWMKGGGKALWKDENIADSIVAHAVAFMRRHKEEPFFMYVATNDIHVPRFPNPRFRGKTNMGVRGDVIAQFDWTVGEILNTLRNLGLEDRTLVILTSDNGPVVNDGYKDRAVELLNGHSPAGALRGNKYSTLEGGTRIPFIVWWPNHVQAGKQSDALLSQIDFFGSMARLLGARVPQGAARDSRNALRTWTNLAPADREWVIQQAADHTLSLRTRTWKYIEPTDTRPYVDAAEHIDMGYSPQPQLYKVNEDVHEDHNVAALYPDTLFRLQTLLRRLSRQRAQY